MWDVSSKDQRTQNTAKRQSHASLNIALMSPAFLDKNDQTPVMLSIHRKAIPLHLKAIRTILRTILPELQSRYYPAEDEAVFSFKEEAAPCTET